MAFSNKYKGNCAHCGIFVSAGEGFYEEYQVTCTETVSTGKEWACLPKFNRLMNTSFDNVDDAWTYQTEKRNLEEQERQHVIRQALINGGLEERAAEARVRSLTQVINKVLGEDVAIADMTFEQITKVNDELVRRIGTKLAAAMREDFKSQNICPRCGGEGHSARWINTGKTCYRCNGSGKYHNV